MKPRNPALYLLPFWIFTLIFKAGNAVYFAALPAIGERIFPIWLVGLIIGAASFIQLPFDLLSGLILDRYGYLKILSFSALASAGAGLALILGVSPFSFILSIVFSVFAWLFFGPGLNAYILSHAEKEKAEKYIILRDVFQSVGVVIGTAMLPLAFLLKPEQIGISVAIVFLISFIFAVSSPKDTRLATEEKKLPAHHYYIRRNYFKDLYGSIKKLNPASWMLLFQGLASSIFYAAVWFAVPLAIADKTKNLPAISLGIFDAAVIALGFAFGYIAKRFHKKVLILTGLFIFGLMAALLGFYEGWIFLFFGFLATMGDELSSISLWTWLSHLDKNHAEDGTVAGVITFFQDLGWAIGPIAAGLLYKPLGVPLTIALTAIPIFIVLIFALIKTKSLPHLRMIGPHTKKPHHFRHKR